MLKADDSVGNVMSTSNDNTPICRCYKKSYKNTRHKNSLAAVLCKIIKDNERWKFHKKGQGPAKSLISNIPRFGHVFYLINQ